MWTLSSPVGASYSFQPERLVFRIVNWPVTSVFPSGHGYGGRDVSPVCQMAARRHGLSLTRPSVIRPVGTLLPLPSPQTMLGRRYRSVHVPASAFGGCCIIDGGDVFAEQDVLSLVCRSGNTEGTRASIIVPLCSLTHSPSGFDLQVSLLRERNLFPSSPLKSLIVKTEFLLFWLNRWHFWANLLKSELPNKLFVTCL